MLQAMLQAARLQAALAEGPRGEHHVLEALKESLLYARTSVDDFVDALQAAGWNTADVRMRSGQSCVLGLE